MFVGRTKELARLQDLYQRGGFQMVVVYGRRRVGKTALINQFAHDKRTLSFTALEQSDRDNLADFSRKVAEFFNLPVSMGGFASWQDALNYIADQAKRERFVFIFDEFPYAAQRNKALPSLLQIAIDHTLQHTNLFLILCGSNQGFMENDVLGRKSPLYGRRTAQIKLGQLNHLEVAQMLPSATKQEAFRFYGCFGGVPYYLQQLRPEESLGENLARLYFDPMGFLYDEPYGLLRQELSEPALFSSILRALASGANRQKEIADKTGIPATSLPRYLSTLENLEIIEKVVPFGESREKSKRGIYRVRDACYEFWFRFIMPRTSDIEAGLGQAIARNLPEQHIDDYLGHRFERLCAEWLTMQASSGTLPIPATSIGSWWGTNPATRRQDDIDVLAADPVEKRLIIGECKYRASFNETAELDDLDSKRSLISGYRATNICLFTRHPVSETTAVKCTGRSDVMLVPLDMMYE